MLKTVVYILAHFNVYIICWLITKSKNFKFFFQVITQVIYMSEVSDFCHGIDTQSGMMTTSMVKKKYHKTLVVLVGGGGEGVEGGVESIWVLLCPYEGWCF